MRTGLLLIDLQRDYLDRPGLVPPESELVPRVAELMALFRQHGLPVFHVITRVATDGTNRMPHWRDADHWACVEGTPGGQPPPELAPAPGEAVYAKPFFSAFDSPELVAALSDQRIGRVVIAGIYTHSCVRETALAAYAHGLRVLVASEAIASTDPLHARLTLDYLQDRGAPGRSLPQIRELLAPGACPTARRTWIHRNPARWDEVLGEVPLADAAEVEAVVRDAEKHSIDWQRLTHENRAERLRRWLPALMQRRERLIELLVLEVGKPLVDARAEFDYTLALLRHTLSTLETSQRRLRPRTARGLEPTYGSLEEASIRRGVGRLKRSGADARHSPSAPRFTLERTHAQPEVLATEKCFETRRRPLGVVGLITPFNNPLAIPVGKLAPALAWGNRAVWKPALAAPRLSALLLESLAEAGLDGAVRLILGDADTGRALVAARGIAAISFTGSIAAGREASAICALHGRPLQAELGGNNAVLVLADADPVAVARQLAPAVFGYAGQRCTAPRRLIVASNIQPAFETALVEAVKALGLGQPADESVRIGPLISRAAQARLVAMTAGALAGGARKLCGGRIPPGMEQGCWFAPTLIADPDPASPVVRIESFGPLAVILPARDLDHALHLCNGVSQGLVASLYSEDPASQQQFLEQAQAGILALNHAPVRIAPEAPFAAWKASGIGPPEHGRWDLEFYTRPQAVYRS
ncbi:MAG: aldehyde dehydrogenase family protein [Panacagrimonas sp.]